MSDYDALTVTAVRGIGEVVPGEDLSDLIAPLLSQAPAALTASSVLIVAQKIVSKAESRQVYLDTITPTPRAVQIAAITGKEPALVEMVLRESTEVLRTRRNLLIVRHRLGFVVANAGIDQSNVSNRDGRPTCLLLPVDPDGSARRLRDGLAARLGVSLGVVVSDSFGRAWRRGVVNVALGSAGLSALVDCRGQLDRFGRTLQVTEVAIGDALAAAAGLLMGEANQSNPVILIQGGRWNAPEVPASHLVRPLEEDVFK